MQGLCQKVRPRPSNRLELSQLLRIFKESNKASTFVFLEEGLGNSKSPQLYEKFSGVNEI